MIDHLDHLVLTTANEGDCIDFYTRVMGIKSRSYLIQMDAALPSDWLPVMHRVIATCGGIIPPDSALLPIIQSCDGNARDIVSSAIRVALEQNRKAA